MARFNGLDRAISQLSYKAQVLLATDQRKPVPTLADFPLIPWNQHRGNFEQFARLDDVEPQGNVDVVPCQADSTFTHSWDYECKRLFEFR